MGIGTHIEPLPHYTYHSRQILKCVMWILKGQMKIDNLETLKQAYVN